MDRDATVRNLHDAKSSAGKIQRTIIVLSSPGAVVELRAFKDRTTASGYFDDYGKLAEQAVRLEEQGFAVYATLNPVDPALLARANNRIKKYPKSTTSDADILRRRWLPLDFDPVRPAGVSSTEGEKRAAWLRAGEVQDYLESLGWSEPMLGDSGNGYHLLYRLDFPSDSKSLELVKGVLEALDFKFSDGAVNLDTTTANAARIWKLYGTTARKGDDIQERPHRVSRLLEIPQEPEVVSKGDLEAVAATKPVAPSGRKHTSDPRRNGHDELDLDGWIRTHSIRIRREGSWQRNGYRWVLEECPWNGHADNAAYIVRFPNGAIAAGCHHDSCEGYGWRDLREHFEPGAYEHNGHGSREDAFDRTPGEIGVILSSVKPERVEWLWQGRIPKGKLSLVDGDPGTGKSALTADLTARVSSGGSWPDGTPCEAGGVVLLSAEDGLADTIRPRLDAAGADSSKVLALAAVPDGEEGERLLSIPQDLSLIEQGIRRVKAALVVVDPLMAFLGSDVDSNKDQHVRRALTPLAALAERTGAAVLVVRHLNKASGGNALYRGGGSIGIIGAARSGLLVAKDPQDDSRRVLAPQKSNLSEPAPSLVFTLEAADNGAVRVSWRGESTLNASKLLSAPADEEGRSAQAEARDFLTDLLEAGPVPSDEVQKEARAAGIAESTLRRAKSSLGVKAEREGEPGKRGGGRWVWTLPAIKMPSSGERLFKPETLPGPAPNPACESQKLAPDLDDQHLDVHNSGGHLKEDPGEPHRDTISTVAAALEKLFASEPEARNREPDRLAMELYFSDYLEWEPTPEEIVSAMDAMGKVGDDVRAR
ncbi:MAG: AAA family ATPase [Rubrobacteraceae bacterium]